MDAGFVVVAGDAFHQRIRFGEHFLFDNVLAGDLHVPVVIHAGSGRDEAAHDDVFLQAAQVVHLAVDGGFGKNPGRLLEGCGRDKAVRRERGLGDTEQHRLTHGRFPVGVDHPLVLFAELELVDNLFG